MTTTGKGNGGRRAVPKLEAGAEISVHARSPKRKPDDVGHVGRRGKVVRIAYASGGETTALVDLDGTLAEAGRREWLFNSEIQVIAGAAGRERRRKPAAQREAVA